MNRSFAVNTPVVVRRPVAQHRRGSVGSFDSYNSAATMLNDGPSTKELPTVTKYSGEIRKTPTPTPGKAELGALRFRCAHCARSFVHVGHWKLHVMGHSRNGRRLLSMPTTPAPLPLPPTPSLSCPNGPGSVSSCLRSGDSTVVSKRMPDAKALGGAVEFNHQQKRFPCQLCIKAFTREHHFKVHMRTHTGERPFRCKECSKSFAQAGTLKAHMRTHSGERPFTCAYCNKSFAVSSNWTRHMRTHRNARPFPCNRCPKAFTESGALKVHMRTHTGERPFACKSCNRTFARADTLKKHCKTHHNVDNATDDGSGSSTVNSPSESPRPHGVETDTTQNVQTQWMH